MKSLVYLIASSAEMTAWNVEKWGAKREILKETLEGASVRYFRSLNQILNAFLYSWLSTDDCINTLLPPPLLILLSRRSQSKANFHSVSMVNKCNLILKGSEKKKQQSDGPLVSSLLFQHFWQIANSFANNLFCKLCNFSWSSVWSYLIRLKASKWDLT